MKKKIVPGEFVIATIVSLPRRYSPGLMRWQNEKDGPFLRAPFRFDGGHKIVLDGDKVPSFVNDNDRERIGIGSKVVAIVRTGREGLSVSMWGHLSEYEKAQGEISREAVISERSKPAPPLPGTNHLPIRKFHHGSRPPQPRRYPMIAAMVGVGNVGSAVPA